MSTLPAQHQIAERQQKQLHVKGNGAFSSYSIRCSAETELKEESIFSLSSSLSCKIMHFYLQSWWSVPPTHKVSFGSDV